MAINYTTLVAGKATEGSIKWWLNYSRLPSADILTEAEAWLYSRLRTQEMVQTADITIADATSELTTETDYLSPIGIMLDGDSLPLRIVSSDTIMERRLYDTDGVLVEGHPTCFYGSPATGGTGGTYYFDTKMDEQKTGVQWYYGTPTALSGSNETNFLTLRYPTILRCACLMIAHQSRGEGNKASELRQWVDAEITAINEEADLSLFGSQFSMRVA